MSSVNTVRLFSGAVPTTDSSVAVVPANTIWVIRDIEVANFSGSTVATIYTSVVGPGSFGAFWTATALANNAHVQWDGRVVAMPGDAIHAFASSGGGVAITLTGYSFPQ